MDVADSLGVSEELDAPDVHHGSLFRGVRAALGRVPTVLLLEDVHWADEATLDLVRFLARRLDGLPLMVVATFRDDEVMTGHPLAGVLGDLATAASVARMQLPLLTAAAVAELASSVDDRIDVDELHRSTDGNPFFVTEVLASGTQVLPRSVRDAVLARAGRLSPAGRRVLDAAAVVGAPGEIGVLIEVSGQDPTALDECVAGGVLLDRGTALAFRHDLARQSILDGLTPGSRLGWHRRVLDVLTASGSQDHRRLAYHAVACGDAAAVVRSAPQAAALAARLGSHREAAQQLRTALEHSAGVGAALRADLLDRFSYECYLTSELSDAVDSRLAAIALHESDGNQRRVGVGQRWLSRYFWYLGRHEEAQRCAAAAVAALEPLGSSGDLAMAYSNVSQLRMLGGDTAEALLWGERALAQALAIGDREVEAHAQNNLGAALQIRGDVVGGRVRLDRSLAIALADGLEEHAVRAWINIGTIEASQRRLVDAEGSLRRGISYCAERDLVSAALYLQGRLSQVLLERGRTDDATRLAGEVVRHPRGSAVSRVAALLTKTTIAVRAGDPEWESALSELRTLAEATAEAQRLLPVALVTAEAAWTAGRTREIIALTDEVWHAYQGWEPWILAELAWWRGLAGSTEELAFGQPEPFALMRAGRAREASNAWTTIGRPFWAALALAAGDPAATSDAVAGLLRSAAPASAQAVRRDLAARGLPVPRGPRPTARTNSAGLTGREIEILELLVEGLSDAEIAKRLTLSERTVGHHVSAVLRKLGVPSRSRAAAAATAVLMSPSAGPQPQLG